MTSPLLHRRVRSLEEVNLTKLRDQVSWEVAKYWRYRSTGSPEGTVYRLLCDAEYALGQAIDACGGPKG